MLTSFLLMFSEAIFSSLLNFTFFLFFVQGIFNDSFQVSISQIQTCSFLAINFTLTFLWNHSFEFSNKTIFIHFSISWVNTKGLVLFCFCSPWIMIFLVGYSLLTILGGMTKSWNVHKVIVLRIRLLSDNLFFDKFLGFVR